jgi:hypothetical protein
MTLQTIIKDIVKRGIPVELQYNRETDTIDYVVSGFFESGTATLQEMPDGMVFALTRHNKVQRIIDFQQLAHLAYCWYLDSKGRDPFNEPSGYWAPTFAEFGWLQKKVKEVVTYE